MGPITLFDKSFLQSLSVDESVWFDHFFLANVCPLFYVETLADLDKRVREGRRPEQEVGIIADKFPEMRGMPCTHHRSLCIGELKGYPIPMTGQVPLANGRRVYSRSGRAAVFEPSPERDAFERWQRREFLEIERQYARIWRRTAPVLDSAEASALVETLGVSERCRNLEQAKLLASKAVRGGEKPILWISFALGSLGVSEELCQHILERWVRSGKPPLVEFAPYTTYVLEVETFFQIALASRLISDRRASNRQDIAYLYYLPFCMMFVSNDRLHARCAPLFLRHNQEFVWGVNLKANLSQVNAHYLKGIDRAKEQGVYSFSDDPPPIGNQMVRNLWLRLLPNWRRADNESSTDADYRGPTPEEVRKLAEAPEMITTEGDRHSGTLDQAVIIRRVKRRKGSWYQVPSRLNYKETD